MHYDLQILNRMEELRSHISTTVFDLKIEKLLAI